MTKSSGTEYTGMHPFPQKINNDGGKGGEPTLLYHQNDPLVHGSKGITWSKSTVKISLISLPLLLIAVCIGWVIVPCFIARQISSKVVISPSVNPDLYSAWLHPPVPVYLKVYLFNVTNPDAIKIGGFPSLEQIGPYVFRENRTKYDIHVDEVSDSITYKEYIAYHFDQELSGSAKMEDIVTLINVPFVAAAIKISHDLPWPIKGLAQAMLVRYKESIFVNKTVEEALFKGFKVPFLEKIEEDAGLTLIPNNTFGFFIGQNDTFQGPYTVSRGSNDKTTFGNILKYKNQSELSFWGDSPASPCNKLSGTDGTIFPPFVTKNRVLTIFNPEVCRSLYLTYSRDSEFEGIKGYRFTAPSSVLMDPRKSEENRCYCQTIDDEPEKCLGQGTLDLGPCRDGAPVALSTVYFLDGSQEYGNKSGLVPIREMHETFMDIEPLTGLILQASKKIQINLILKPVKGLSFLSKVPDMLFPLVWADECASLDMENTNKFKSALFQLWIIDFVCKWVLLAVTLVICLTFLTRNLTHNWLPFSRSNSTTSTQDYKYKRSNNGDDDEGDYMQEDVSQNVSFTQQDIPLHEAGSRKF